MLLDGPELGWLLLTAPFPLGAGSSAALCLLPSTLALLLAGSPYSKDALP